MERINAWLDALPRTHLGSLGRQAPAFRSLGIAGYYVAAAVTLGAGMLTGRSLPVLAGLAAVCALSFFAYALGRKWVTGHENLVLLEHVWFALLCSAGAAWLFGADLLWHLDAVAVGLCFFLAFGRAGCAVAGCCHGQPSSVGFVYGEAHAQNGFEPGLVGVRLFPVQLLELGALVLIGLVGLGALPFAPAGAVLGLFLVSYAIVRFGLEGLRGDARPHLGGLSQSRWMAAFELAFAVGLTAPSEGPQLWGAATAGGVLLLALFAHVATNRRRRLLSQRHVKALRALVEETLEGAGPTPGAPVTSPSGVAVTASQNADGSRHLSLSLAEGSADLPLLCELAVAVCPGLDANAAAWTPRGVLHLVLGPQQPSPPALARRLYLGLVRDGQAAAPPGASAERPEAVASLRSSYFGRRGKGSGGG